MGDGIYWAVSLCLVTEGGIKLKAPQADGIIKLNVILKLTV